MNSYNIQNELVFKSYISYLNELLSLLWKVGGVFLLLIMVLLWVYLRDIGWPSLFLESVASLSGFTAVVSVVSLLTGFIFISCSVSSAILIFSFWLLGDGQLPKKLVFPILLVVIFWLSIIATSGHDVQVVLAWFLALANLVVYLVVSRELQTEVSFVRGGSFSDPPKKVGWFWMEVLAFFQFLMVVVSVFLTVLPLTIILGYVGEVSDLNGVGLYSGFLLLIFIPVLVALFPGLAYLFSRCSGDGEKRGLHAAAASYALVGYLFVMVLLSSGYGGFLMKKVGIINNDISTYAISSNLPKGLFGAAGIDVDRYEGNDFVRVYLRYGVGDVRLLCKEKYDFPDPFQFGRREIGVQALSIGGGCVSVHASDVREYKEKLACTKDTGLHCKFPS